MYKISKGGKDMIYSKNIDLLDVNIYLKDSSNKKIINLIISKYNVLSYISYNMKSIFCKSDYYNASNVITFAWLIYGSLYEEILPLLQLLSINKCNKSTCEVFVIFLIFYLTADN